MRIGYASLAIGVGDANYRNCLQKHASRENLMDIICHNIQVLDRIIDYNFHHNIRLFRITSGLIPFGSSPVNDLPWWNLYAPELSAIGEKIKRYDMRVSMHPGQYTVLNSPDEETVAKAVSDLMYHRRVLESLNVGRDHKIIIHVGGSYHDKELAKKRFLNNLHALDDGIRDRLVIENDDRNFHIGDVLELSIASGLPVVYDNLHNALNPYDNAKDDLYWIRAGERTWKANDGIPKIHYAQQDPAKRPGAHSFTIRIRPFLEFYEQVRKEDIDIMLEVKDKNLSAIKCQNVVSNQHPEAEWNRYKNLVSAKAPDIYEEINTRLLEMSVAEFYEKIEQAMDQENDDDGEAHLLGNILQAIRPMITPGEAKRAEHKPNLPEGQLKSYLWNLIKKYRIPEYLEDYYFLLSDFLG